MKEEKQIEELTRRIEKLERKLKPKPPKYSSIQDLRKDAEAYYNK